MRYAVESHPASDPEVEPTDRQESIETRNAFIHFSFSLPNSVASSRFANGVVAKLSRTAQRVTVDHGSAWAARL